MGYNWAMLPLLSAQQQILVRSENIAFLSCVADFHTFGGLPLACYLCLEAAPKKEETYERWGVAWAGEVKVLY